VLDLLLEEFVIHGHFPQFLPQPGDLLVSGVPGAFFQFRLAGVEELVPPLRQAGGGYAQLPGKQFQVFTTQKTQDALDFAPGGKTLVTLARALSGRGPLRHRVDDLRE
jgi:hypothetical protein